MEAKLTLVGHDGTRVIPTGEWSLEGKALLVGSQAGCDVLLADASVSQKHFRLVPEKDTWLVEDLGSPGGTRLNGRLLEPNVPVPLRPDDTIQAGVYSLVFMTASEVVIEGKYAYGPAEIGPTENQFPLLEEITAEGRGQIHFLGPQKQTLLGRGTDCDIVLHDAAVSRHHAFLCWRARKVFCRDAGSSNGTWLNGRKLQGEKRIKSGDILQLGRHRLLFSDFPCENKKEAFTRAVRQRLPVALLCLLGMLGGAVSVCLFCY